jgi:cytoskeletal protein CcmA (bactofilin family)
MAVLRPQGAEDTTQARRFTDGTQAFTSVIGAEVTVIGELHGRTNLDLKGRIKGNLDIDGLVWLRPTSRLDGNLRATDVIIEGSILGNVKARNKVDIRTSGSLEGDIDARLVAAAEGSFFQGAISMSGASSGKAEVVTYHEKRQVDEGADQD